MYHLILSIFDFECVFLYHFCLSLTYLNVFARKQSILTVTHCIIIEYRYTSILTVLSQKLYSIKRHNYVVCKKCIVIVTLYGLLTN